MKPDALVVHSVFFRPESTMYCSRGDGSEVIAIHHVFYPVDVSENGVYPADKVDLEIVLNNENAFFL